MLPTPVLPPPTQSPSSVLPSLRLSVNPTNSPTDQNDCQQQNEHLVFSHRIPIEHGSQPVSFGSQVSKANTGNKARPNHITKVHWPSACDSPALATFVKDFGRCLGHHRHCQESWTPTYGCATRWAYDTNFIMLTLTASVWRNWKGFGFQSSTWDSFYNPMLRHSHPCSTQSNANVLTFSEYIYEQALE
jgi:hypothetical protein